MRVPFAILPILSAAATACGPAEFEVGDDLTATGELVAMSGGTAGAGNACFTCHGLDGRGNGAGVPRLAGLDAGYIQHQMAAYADGRRENPSMRWIARQLTPRETALVSSYYSELTLEAQAPAPEPGREAPVIFFAGDSIRNIPACASCHGADGGGLGPGIPPLAGQPRQYLEQQLHLWRKAKRRSDPGGAMLEIARWLTPAEIAGLSAYAAALPVASRPGSRAASPSGRRSGPRNDVSTLPRRVAGS